MFGESAGVHRHALSQPRVYVRVSPERRYVAEQPYSSQLNYTSAPSQIFESGSAASLPPFPALHGQTDWDNFLHVIPECKFRLDSPFNCLCTVNSSVLLNTFEVSTAQSNKIYPWTPTIDGPGGLLPAKLFAAGHFPFITGTNLDEGTVI
jgi:hypothetical protein